MGVNKIKLIIQREYLSRVRKKSFIIMTIVGPILAASLLFLKVMFSEGADKLYNVTVVDETGLFVDKLQETESVKFQYVTTSIDETKQMLNGSDNYSILFIPEYAVKFTKGIKLYSEKTPGRQLVLYLEGALSRGLEKAKLNASGIDPRILASTKTIVKINAIQITADGEQKSPNAQALTLSFVGSFLIYFFILMYGIQVMRGVMEEKTNRIVEVIISSVKPFQLMLGKIVGIALVSLTQFTLWVVLTFIITGFVGKLIIGSGADSNALEKMMQNTASVEKIDTNPESDQKAAVIELFESVETINFPLIIGTFLFYFIGGYLLYGALFGAIGAAVDSETDNQQFVLPLTIPLILAFLMSQVILNDPEGPVAFWFSMVPLTSPVVMMMRIPFGVPAYELFLSMAFLIIGFVVATWIAGKIYRTGILLYGKKVGYKELGKWLFYKD